MGFSDKLSTVTLKAPLRSIKINENTKQEFIFIKNPHFWSSSNHYLQLIFISVIFVYKQKDFGVVLLFKLPKKLNKSSNAIRKSKQFNEGV